jgi:cadherin 5 type 2 (VE-cadherin)
MPLITSEITVINQPEVTTALTLRYTPTPLTSALFDTYRFMLSDASIPVMEKAAQDPDRKVTFVDLIPGRLYNITLWTVSGGVTSKPLERQDRLHPEPVSGLNATKITDKEITLVWQPPIGDYDHFDVLYDRGFGRDRLTTNSTLVNSITIRRLRPFKNYTFSVFTISGTSTTIQRSSAPISAQFATKESEPGALTSFEPEEVQPSHITFQWDLPEANGIITGFVIEYYPAQSETLRSLDPKVFKKEFSAHERTGTIENLMPGVRYIFKIKANTRVGSGPWVRWEQLMPIWAPPVPDRRTIATELSHTMTSVTIRFRRSYFSDVHGKVISYAVIVTEDYSKPTDNKLSLLTWHDVQHFRLWPPYKTADPFYPFTNSSVEDYVIGVENCENKAGTYCNGPLKPGGVYRFKIRAYTSQTQFSETHWSQQIQTDPDNTAFLVGIIIPIILLLLVALVVLGVRRMKSGSGSSCMKRSLPGDMRHGDNISLPDSVIETSKPVKLKDFSEHYRIMSADSDFRFSEEYEELKHVGREKPCTAADMPVNRPKNRFTNILPYDHSRVKLQPADDEEGSDYINANFVPGFNSPREFIVTQGPLHSTRDDFWRSCWETNSRAIVMLTRCVEKGREKCDHYWPYDTQPVFYGDIQVTILNESHFPDWNVSEFRMMRGDTVRTIRHFHFTTWPDFGVPEPPQTLVRFVRAFRERVTPEQRPVVVHCSAGVGRSGTFIALDRILQSIRKYDVVDIFGIVYEMRKERVWMVQTEQQYICIHQCLLTVLEGKENDPQIHEIHENEGFEDDEGIAESGM